MIKPSIYDYANMNSFHSTRREDRMTCRLWLSGPGYCRAINCPHTHADTGYMSPPSVFACYAYNNGGCRLPDDECVFTHAIADPYSLPRLCHRDLSLWDVPIAEAAAKAGFDCSDWPSLRHLIDAMRAVSAPAQYPDRWTGPAAFRSSIYPDRWTANHQNKRRKGVIHAYRDAERSASVLASVSSATQPIRSTNRPSRSRATASSPALRGTGSNRIPLGPISGNKRRYGEASEVLSPSQKRLKPDEAQGYILTHQSPNRQGAKQDNYERSESQYRTRQYFNQDRMSRDTDEILNHIAVKLRANLHAIDEHRHILRQQWEIDEHLQLLTVSNDLAELNRCFQVAENGNEGALDVVQKRLL